MRKEKYQSIQHKINTWATGFCLSLEHENSDYSVLPREMERRHLWFIERSLQEFGEQKED